MKIVKKERKKVTSFAWTWTIVSNVHRTKKRYDLNEFIIYNYVRAMAMHLIVIIL